ncbi:MAG: Fe-S protein assembly chaperone HscA [Alphaproteobacteria bacterium]|nr:Fe-S protein assembly chaperone HscA [Alphaproteobacteria bacterium]
MSLIQINDVASTKKQKESTKEEEVAIGIDLGTSNSVISYFDGESLQIIGDSFGDLIPSAVYYAENKVLVGKKALAEIGAFKSIKRFMGKSTADINESLYDYDKEKKTIFFKNQQSNYVSLEEISAEILKYLKNTAEEQIGKKVSSSVITVPAYFDENQRIATKNAAQLAGLKVLRLINEPTSAALAYGLEDTEDESLQGVYLVYDLGGGTFDISVLSLQKGVFKVLATLGDTLLGGDDIDNIIMQEIINSLNISIANQDKAYFLEIAKTVKEKLSSENMVNQEIIYNDKKYNFYINRENFIEKIKPLVEKTLNMCVAATEDAEVEDIKGVILVGGSTKIPYIQNRLKDLFKVEPISSLNPDLVVAMGAGYKAAELTGKTKNSLLLDVIPLSLGIELAGGIVEKIIHRNTLIPITKKQEFTTYKDNQTAMSIHILQGERELVKDLRSLGKFSLKGIPPLPAGAAKVMVSFSIDADGLLSVCAVEEKTGISQSIEIKPAWGLDFESMLNMLESSMENASSDMQQRLLLQSKTEAERVADSLKSALRDDGELLSESQKQEIIKVLEELLTSMQGENRDLIEENVAKLDKATSEFAELRMNKKINKALAGKSLTEVEDKLL